MNQMTWTSVRKIFFLSLALVFIMGAMFIASSSSKQVHRQDILKASLADQLSPTSTTLPQPAVNATPTLTPTPTPTLTPTAMPVWTTILSFKGSNSTVTQLFTVPNDWLVVWSCGPNGSGVFSVIVHSNGDSSYAVNQFCQGFQSSTSEVHLSGLTYLQVNSTSPWAIEIQLLQ